MGEPIWSIRKPHAWAWGNVYDEAELRKAFQSGVIGPDWLARNFDTCTTIPVSALLQQLNAATHAAQSNSQTPNINPVEGDHCFVICRGERRGPYLPEQIRTMWKSGTITADAGLVWGDITDPVPLANFMSEPPPIQSNPSTAIPGNPALTALGLLMFVGGIIGLLYYWQFFDTSVIVPTERLFGQTLGEGRVHNIGLMQDRQNGMIISGIAAALGFVSILLGQYAGKRH